MVWRFLKHYGVAKAHEVLDDFAQSVVAFDPASASKALMSEMESELTRLGHRLVEAEQEVEREHRETRQLEKTYGELLSAARIIEEELPGIGNPAQRSGQEATLETIVVELERLKPEIVREAEEDREVEAWRVELRRADVMGGDRISRDPGVAEALARARGQSRVSGQSLSSRLPALAPGPSPVAAIAAE